jgi:hypothetical protein
MGFLDKAKKMAEQAQAKIDEAQKQFNEGQKQEQPSGPAVEYDSHGRPIPQEPPASASPPHGDPVAPSSAPPPAPAAPPAPTPGVPPTGQGDPVADPPPPAPPVEQPGVPPTTEPPAEDRNHPSYAPPKLSSGDPLAG